MSKEAPSFTHDLRKLLSKWTGYSFLKKKYKAWLVRKARPETDKYNSRINHCETQMSVSTGRRTLRGSFGSFFAQNGTTTTMEGGNIKFDYINGSFPITEEQLINHILDRTVDDPLIRAISEASSNQYTILRVLGVGSFSKVRLAIDKSTGDKVAIKMIKCSEVKNVPRLRETLTREIEILKLLSHPNIVRFKEVTLLKESICLVMDYISGCELFQYVADRNKLSEDETRVILRQILLGLQYLHQNGIAHRDLKLENVLIDVGQSTPLATLVDFGLARITKSGNPLTTRCGSEEYAAPEVILGDPYDGRLADIWSFGVVMYACLTGFLPFNPDSKNPRLLSERIVSVSYRHPDDMMSQCAARIIKSILLRRPEDRPTVDVLLRHPYFNLSQPNH